MPKQTTITLPSTRYLGEALDYSQETGELRWRERPLDHFISEDRQSAFNTRLVGTVAGAARSTAGCVIGLNGTLYQTHRVIWKWMTGEEPPLTLDHKDGNPFNNRWNNLRAATVRQQTWNRERTRNIAPARGVFPVGKKWRARIMINGIQHNLGTFPTVEEAAAAYDAAARKHHGEFYLRR